MKVDIVWKQFNPMANTDIKTVDTVDLNNQQITDLINNVRIYWDMDEEFSSEVSPILNDSYAAVYGVKYGNRPEDYWQRNTNKDDKMPRVADLIINQNNKQIKIASKSNKLCKQILDEINKIN